MGQSAFGKEKMLKDEKEVTFQKWCGLFESNNGFAVINDGALCGKQQGEAFSIFPCSELRFIPRIRFLDRPITDSRP